MTRLQARISSLERLNLYNHTPSLSALHKIPHSPGRTSSAHSPPSSPKKLQTPDCSSALTHSTCLRSPVHTQTHPTSAPHLPESPHTHKWVQSSSTDSSLDLPLSLKAALREALSRQPWESSSPSVSPVPDTVDHSWQGLSAVDATAASDLSFNPLTYMVDKQNDANPDSSMLENEWESESRRASVRTLVCEDQETPVTSLTGMLRFVNQTLAMQEDPSLWSSTGLSNS